MQRVFSELAWRGSWQVKIYSQIMEGPDGACISQGTSGKRINDAKPEFRYEGEESKDWGQARTARQCKHHHKDPSACCTCGLERHQRSMEVSLGRADSTKARVPSESLASLTVGLLNTP